MRVILAITLLSSIAFAQNPVPKKKPASASAETVEKFESYQLIPKDESAKDKSLVEYLNKLKKAIDSKDVKALEGMLNSQIKYSFGGGEETPKGFLSHFKLDRNPAGSPFWNEAKRVLEGGGAFREMPIVTQEGDLAGSVTAYVAPYVYAGWPDDKPEFEFYEFSAINSKDVPVYKSQSPKSGVLEKVSYLIVRGRVVGTAPSSRTLIALPNGKKGYVETKFLSSPLGYRASFVKRNGAWKMDFFISGD